VEEPEYLTAEELLAMFPQAAQDPSLGLRAVDLGLIQPEGDRFRVPSPTMLRAGAELVAAGIPLAATQDEFAALRTDMERVATRFVELFERHVWQPFVDAGMPSEQLPQVTEALRRMRPLAATSVQAMLARAMEHQTAASTATQVKLISEGGPAPEQEGQQ
jgi:hypothetical protein